MEAVFDLRGTLKTPQKSLIGTVTFASSVAFEICRANFDACTPHFHHFLSQFARFLANFKSKSCYLAPWHASVFPSTESGSGSFARFCYCLHSWTSASPRDEFLSICASARANLQTSSPPTDPSRPRYSLQPRPGACFGPVGRPSAFCVIQPRSLAPEFLP